MATQELKNIAKANGLEIANVGFAKVALYGFANFEQAEDFADKNDLEVVEIKKKATETLNIALAVLTMVMML